MREAFNNQPQKLKTKQTQQQNLQLSQRSTQAHHQKTNSMQSKTGFPLQQQIMAYDEQQQIQGTMNSQPSGHLNQFHQSMNVGGQVKNSSVIQVTGIASGHKKSNSLINSKMAQILLKGPQGGVITGNTTTTANAPNHVVVGIQQVNNNMSTNIRDNQIIYHPKQQYIPNLGAQESYKNQQQQQQLQHQQNNTSNSIVAGATVSHQTSFAQHQNDLISYSIDYQKPYFYDEYEDQSNQHSHLNLQSLHQQQQQQMFMNQVPSNKQILTTHPKITQQQQKQPNPLSIENFIQQPNLNDISNPQIKKQMTQSNQKPTVCLQTTNKGQSSAQKPIKKSITQSGGGGHQRTKSDTYYNRGSITAQNKQNIGAAQQSKRIQGNSNLILKNNFIETHDGRSMASSGISNQKNPGGQYILLNAPEQTQQRKAPQSAHHSKKPSTGSNITQVGPPNQINIAASSINQSKKSTREKYIELKALYNDLLERHYVQQQHTQQPYQHSQQAIKGFQAQPSNQNLINFYPNNIQLQASYLPDASQNNSNTPRITMTNQLSQSAINANLQLLSNEIQSKQQQLQQQQKTMKHQTSKIETNNLQDSLSSKPQHQLQPKAAIKLNLAQGISRKVVGSGTHKRSVSDGNEQLFKFKQQAMQRYLYPQPSNQTLQQTSAPQNTQNTDDTIASSRSKIVYLQGVIGGPQQTPYQQPAHQRRVSDDYNQKQKKSQLHLQSQLVGSQSSVMQHNINIPKSQQNQSNIQNPSMMVVENVPNDYPHGETQKPNPADFNIKGFLLEMRNKHEKQAPAGFINIVDEQHQQHLIGEVAQNSPSNMNMHSNKLAAKSGKQFAMIIEENSPIGGNAHNSNNLADGDCNILYQQQHQLGTLDSSRKMSLVDSQSQMLLQNNLLSQASKPNIEFNKILQKYKQMKLDEKRSSSPNLEMELKQKNPLKKGLPQNGHHKRVKSDIPEIPKKNQLALVPHSKPSSGLNKKTSQQTSSGQNLVFNSDKNTPRKQHQLIPGKNQLHFGQGGFQMLSSNGGANFFEASGLKKVINVSIDLIKDTADLDNSGSGESSSLHEVGAGGQWIMIDNSSSNQDLNIENNKGIRKTGHKAGAMSVAMNNGKQQSASLINQQFVIGGGFSGGQVDQRQDKYKKMKQKYEAEIINVSGANNKNKYTFDNNNITDKSGGNNSPIQHTSPKGRFSLLSDKPLNNDLLGTNKKTTSNKQFVPNSPKQQIALSLQKGSQSSKAKQQSSSAQQQSKKNSNVSSLLQQQPVLQQIQQPIKQSVNAAPPNNSVVQTQESARNSLLVTNNNVNLQNIGERIETQDSTVSDQNLSPRTRGITKLTKHVLLSFKQTQQPPNTTVDFYRIGKVLGKGAFGKVNLALHKLTQKFVAVKSINKQYLSEEAQTKKVMQEVVILKRTRQRNIVRLYEFFETQKHILFVIELCAGGDLLNYVRRRRRLKEDVAKVIFKQIIEGLGYCHSKNILHRDIKLDNILLDSLGEVKICDFGVSKIVKKGEIMTEQCGTPAYIAPEILRDRGYEGFQVDVWSAGVVLYAMLYGTVPFKANNMSELQKLIIKAKYTLKDDISAEAMELLKGLLEKDPLKRLTIPQILQHAWLKDADDTPLELFTDQEKEYISNEFTYNDTDRFNRNETDPFTEHMLDSTQNSMLKNQSSKSVILAPFNSTLSNLEEFKLSESIQQMMQSRRCLKFAARVRDVDRQYEMNNNADLDNGVYHKVEEDEENKDQPVVGGKERNSDDSLQSSFNKESIRSEEDEEMQRIKNEKKKKSKKKEKQTELEKLESLICQQEEEDDNDNPYGNKNNQNEGVVSSAAICIKDQQQQPQPSSNQVKRSPRLISQNSQLQEQQLQQVLQTAQTLIIDEFVVVKIEQYGYPREYIVKSLNNNELNYATTSYYLLQNKHTLTFKEEDATRNANGGGARLTNRTIL